MGFTTVQKSMFSHITQTPGAVAKVLDIAGWNASEAAHEIGIPTYRIIDALDGSVRLDDEMWRKLLDVAGRRAFDADDQTA